MLWELPILTTVCIVVTSLWWFCNRQTASPRTLCALAVAAALAVAVDSRRTALQLCGFAYDAALNATPTQQFEMVLTIGAVIWSVAQLSAALGTPQCCSIFFSSQSFDATKDHFSLKLLLAASVLLSC